MIVNIYHKEPYDVYIGRAGKSKDGYFGNPIIKNKECIICKKIHKEAGDTLNCYEIYARKRIENDLKFKENVKKLYGKTLGCFCRPRNGFQDKLLCHGQILEKLAIELQNK